ncbi:hypothetical protein [Flexithrix dorotheae]|uniref:hypothetical protein n=1 Tax=Flexithrix dorotheae TaxID=70993 RepID=UPI000371B5EE|nr:hypothetical protein [Flexithrix dorotheae]
MISKEILYYGNEKPLKPARELRAGGFRMVYENGFLRYIKLGNSEVLRMIYFALRDQNWDTIEGQIEHEKILAHDQSFSISYEWHSRNPAFPFVWNCQLKGKEIGEIIFEIKGKALESFRKNRSGFCVLHPIAECAGKSCKVDLVNGNDVEGQFPQNISPHQPFMDMKAISWKPDGETMVKLEFEGDTFEMEDQRNWTDDSYKTYCTPLVLPFPVELQKGTEVHQTIKLSIVSGNTLSLGEENKIISLVPEPEDYGINPKIGLEKSSTGLELTKKDIGLIKSIGFDHFRAEVNLTLNNWKVALVAAVGEAQKLELALELVLFFSNQFEKELNSFCSAALKINPSISHILIFHQAFKSTPKNLIDAVVPKLKTTFPEAKIGAGTNAYFTELNRERVEATNLDFVSYSLNPQVHAFDHDSLTETLAAQAYTVNSAKAYFPHKEINISPITLKPRFNPNATTEAMKNEPGVLPEQVDSRQMSLYGAAWTMGSMVELKKSGVNSLTYFETFGWRGIMAGQYKPGLTEQFYAAKGMIFPLYHIFKLFLKNKKARWIPLKSSQPLKTKGIIFREENSRDELLIANYSGSEVTIDVAMNEASCWVGFLDENNVKDSWNELDFFEKLTLDKYEISNNGLTLKIKPFGIAYGKI